MKIHRLLWGGCLLSLLSACQEKAQDPCATSFDQTALLTQAGQQIIWPRYQLLRAQVDSLHDLGTRFADQPQAPTLDSLQRLFERSYQTWQGASITEFGPAETAQLRKKLNNYPLFTQRLEDQINSGTYDLDAPASDFARGFPALDYLLYGQADLLAWYTTQGQANNRRQYLRDVLAHLRNHVRTVVNAWDPAQGNYLQTFINNKGTATGQSVSLLVNQLSQHYEGIKNDQLGTPVGAKVSYIPSPEKVQGRYSGLSAQLVRASVLASKDLFLGASSTGLDDYLAAAANNDGNNPLQNRIAAQYDLAIQRLDALNGQNLQQAIGTQFQNVQALYAAVLDQIILLKTDMPSLLCVSITYQDNTDDGD